MISLALETSGRIGSVALAVDGTVVGERSYPHGLQHAAAIVPMTDELLRERSLSPREVGHIYLSIGPGSFTGLRVGVTLAKTMAFATGAKLVAVPSVRILVENAPADAKHATVVLDAKRGQVFTASFDRVDGDWIEREPARLDRLSDVIARSPKPLHLIGEGIPYHRDAIPADSGVVVTHEPVWQARASVVARLGAAMAARGLFTDAFELQPTYVRLPEAEEKRLIAEGKLATDGRPL